MNQQELAKNLYNACYLRGDFKLRSGQRSQEYFDKYRFESQPQLLSEVAKLMVPLIPDGTQLLAGLELGGVPIATALSLASNIPVVFVRKSAKQYGTCKFAEGADVAGKNVLVIEDVITSGGQALISTADLRNEGAIISTIVCVLFRSQKSPEAIFQSENLTLKSLFTLDEIVMAVGKN